MRHVRWNYYYFDPGDEKAFLMRDAKKHGIPLGYDGMMRLAREGVTSCATGKHVYLRVCQLSMGLGTTKEEYRRFIRALNGIEDPPETP